MALIEPTFHQTLSLLATVWGVTQEPPWHNKIMATRTENLEALTLGIVTAWNSYTLVLSRFLCVSSVSVPTMRHLKSRTEARLRISDPVMRWPMKDVLCWSHPLSWRVTGQESFQSATSLIGHAVLCITTARTILGP